MDGLCIGLSWAGVPTQWRVSQESFRKFSQYLSTGKSSEFFFPPGQPSPATSALPDKPRQQLRRSRSTNFGAPDRERRCYLIDVGAVVWCWVAPRCGRSGGSPICTLVACGGVFFLKCLAAQIQNFASAPDSRSRADVAGARNRRRWPKNLTGTVPGTRTRGGGGFVTDQLQNFFHSTHILSVFATKRRRCTFSVTSKLTERLQDVSRCQVLHTLETRARGLGKGTRPARGSAPIAWWVPSRAVLALLL